MCGIAGAFTDKPISEEVIYKTIAELKNRGPDSNGFIRRRSKNGRFITLIHTRLSILDLNSRSSQPMSSKISDLIFNGENRKTKSGTLARAVLLDSSANGGNDIRVHTGWRSTGLFAHGLGRRSGLGEIT